jgi:hypothetical protein
MLIEDRAILNEVYDFWYLECRPLLMQGLSFNYVARTQNKERMLELYRKFLPAPEGLSFTSHYLLQGICLFVGRHKKKFPPLYDLDQE